MLKKLFLLFIASLSVIEINAQARWGVEAGVNLSFPSNTNETKTGWNVGLIGEYNMNKGLFAETALKLTSKPFCSTNSWKLTKMPVSDWQEATGYGWTGTPYYLNIPLRMGYKIDLKAASLSLAAGPYIGFGLFGTAYHHYQYLKKGEKEYRHIETPEEDDIFGRDLMTNVEAGVSLRLGAEVAKHYRLSAEYNLQLNKMLKNQPITEHNQTLSINIGYMF